MTATLPTAVETRDRFSARFPLKRKHLAVIFSVTTTTVQRWIESGRLPLPDITLGRGQKPTAWSYELLCSIPIVRTWLGLGDPPLTDNGDASLAGPDAAANKDTKNGSK